MNNQMISPEESRAVARALFGQLHRGQEEWFDLAWEFCTRQPLGGDQTVAWNAVPGLGAIAQNDPATQQLARDFAVMAATFLIQSAVARNQLIEHLKEACSKRGHAKPVREWITRAAEEILDRQISRGSKLGGKSVAGPSEPQGDPDYLVWNLNAHDVLAGEPEKCASSDIGRRFWGPRDKYDLFIHKGLLFAPKKMDKEIPMKGTDFRLLVAMLVHKGEALDPMRLYLLAWKVREPAPGQVERDILVDYIKPAVARLRDCLDLLVPNFNIPDKRTANGYAIRGIFSCCIILSNVEADPYLKL
jgi:hypothetical protein